MEITKISYGRVYSLGNYENEKIHMEATVAPGDDVLKSFFDLKLTVEHAHAFRDDQRAYERAKQVFSSPESFTGREVKQAEAIIKEFEAKYPNLVRTEALLPVAETYKREEDF